MEHGTVIANVAYEKIVSGEKKYVRIGCLVYFRAHKEGSKPSCQFRWDVVPGAAWKKDPETWFIGNFIPSEKVPDAPYLCGKIYTTSDSRNDHVVVGHINTRQRDHNDDTQYFMQFEGVPIGEVLRQQRKAILAATRMAVSALSLSDGSESVDTIMGNIESLFDAKSKSVFCQIETD